MPGPMNLDDILLSEMSQIKTNTVWYHLQVESVFFLRKADFIETDNRMMVARG